jgi:uncharacterized membrane protein YdjX (TVP38/TMEM64 family)
MTRRLLLAGAAAALLFAFILMLAMPGIADAILRLAEYLSAAEPDLMKRHYALLLFAYVAAFTVCVALCLPAAAVMTILGGVLFGFTGFIAALLAITFGSVGPFLASRRLAGPALARVDSRAVERFRGGFARNQLQYLVLMRLVPWAPFPVTTIVAGALGMGVARFVVGTALGFVPAGLALNAIGHGLGGLGDLRTVSAAQLYGSPDFLLGIAGIGAIVLLTLLPRVPGVARYFQ